MTGMGKLRRTVSAAVCTAATVALLGTGTAAADGREGGDDGRPAILDGDGLDGDGRVWSLQETGTDSRFRGLDAVNRRTAWVAGSGGTVLRTTDGGRDWQDVSPPGQHLEFRDVQAVGARSALVLAIGAGEDARVLRTDDGGATWTETFRNRTPEAFYNCMTFFDRQHGLAVSDPVDGKFRILSTDDGGRSWEVLPDEGMPPAQESEYNFAASGQCLVSSGPKDVWMASGGAETARIYHSEDRGHTWTVTDAAIPAGEPAQGVFALAFRDRDHGLAVGGDYRAGEESPDASAVSGDGGETWSVSDRPVPEYRSGVAWLPHSRHAALAVGPTGTGLTLDGGRTWATVDDGSFDTVDCTGDFACWASGEQGRVARLGG